MHGQGTIASAWAWCGDAACIAFPAPGWLDSLLGPGCLPVAVPQLLGHLLARGLVFWRAGAQLQAAQCARTYLRLEVHGRERAQCTHILEYDGVYTIRVVVLCVHFCSTPDADDLHRSGVYKV